MPFWTASLTTAASLSAASLSAAWKYRTSNSDAAVAVTAEQAREIQHRFESLIWEVLEEHGGPPGPIGEGERRFNVVVSTFVDTEEPAWDAEDGG